jgi:hypothetical protein
MPRAPGCFRPPTCSHEPCSGSRSRPPGKGPGRRIAPFQGTVPEAVVRIMNVVLWSGLVRCNIAVVHLVEVCLDGRARPSLSCLQ